MSELFYLICFLAALLLSGIYMFNWRKNYDVHLTLIFALVPIVNAGYLMLAQARTAEAAVNAYKIVYIGGCYLHLIIMLAVFSLCGIRLGKWLRTLFMIISSVVYLSVITIGKNDLFYKSYHFEQAGGVHTLVKEYGIMHRVFYMLVIGYFAMSLGALIYAFVRKTQVSRKILLMLFLPAAVCVGCYLAGKWMTPPKEIVPAGYVFAQLSYLAIVYRISLYDVSETAMESIAGSNSTGFISFDLDRNYLGSDETAKEILPQLNDLTVDLPLSRSEVLDRLITPWLDSFDADPSDHEGNRHFYEKATGYTCSMCSTCRDGSARSVTS